MAREFIENQIKNCVQCGNEFIWYWREQIEMSQRQERMRLTDPNATLPPPKRCRVCRMRRWNERQQKDKFNEVKTRDDARIKTEIERERQRKLDLSGNLTRIIGFHFVNLIEAVSLKMAGTHG